MPSTFRRSAVRGRLGTSIDALVARGPAPPHSPRGYLIKREIRGRLAAVRE